MSSATKTDLGLEAWAIDDDVTQLREWGTEKSYALPAPIEGAELTLGSADICDLQLVDPTGCLSRQHARLTREGGRWIARDLDSKNGMHLDGVKRPKVLIEPGSELRLGGVTLIAESPRLVTLRDFLARLLGWSSDRHETVDLAIRSVRLSATRRAALALCGEGDLVPTARSIHEHALGWDRPFIVCDPRRRPGKATVRSAENYETGLAAFEAAAGGTLCVRSRRLPRDFGKLLTALRSPGARVQLVVCGDQQDDVVMALAAPIAVPPLEGREAELDRIIAEYAEDAIAQLGTRSTDFLPVDRAWVREHAATSLPEIEKATRRLVALRESRNLTSAAARLGMAPVSLSRWIGRRSLPMPIG